MGHVKLLIWCFHAFFFTCFWWVQTHKLRVAALNGPGHIRALNVYLPGREAILTNEIVLVGVALLVEAAPEVALARALGSQFTANQVRL